MTQASDGLDAVLRSRGLRATPQRRFVLDALQRLGHGTPDQVWEQVQAVAPALSPSTVYRTLELLEELGLVQHTHLGHGAPTYSVASEADHVHLVCRDCGAVDEAPPELVAPLVEGLAAARGFSVDVGHFAVLGQCRECAAAE